MARNQQEHVEMSGDAGTLWAESAARAGYTVHNSMPHIGISGDEGEGYIVPVPAPQWFTAIDDEGTRDNVFRALAAHALRVGQAKLKQASEPSREVAANGVALAVNGGYKPSKDRSNDIVDSEANKMFARFIEDRVRAVLGDKTVQGNIDDTVTAKLLTEEGKAKLNEFRDQIIQRGTYEVQRKARGKAGSAVVDVPME